MTLQSQKEWYQSGRAGAGRFLVWVGYLTMLPAHLAALFSSLKIWLVIPSQENSTDILHSQNPHTPALGFHRPT
jgi:hypothetical protein